MFVTIFILVLVGVNAQPQYNISYQTYSPYFENLNNVAAYGAGIVVDSNYLEPQNGFSNSIIPSQSCSRVINGSNQNLGVTLDGKFFCLYSDDNSGLALNQINPSNSEIFESYPYSGSNTAFITTTDNFVILGGYKLGSSYFSADVFDTKTSNFICSVPTIFAGLNNTFNLVSMMADALILVAQYQPSPMNTSFYYISCSTGDYIVTSVNDDLYRERIWSFNQSTILVTVSASLFYKSFIQTVTFDLTGTVRFGPQFDIGSFYSAAKLNDSTLLLPSFNPNQQYVLDIEFLVFDLNLEMVTALDFHTGLAMPSFSFNSILIGTSNLIMSNGHTFLYDFQTKNITQVWSQSQPIILANQSVINTTQGGYFIQSPGEPIYFISAPILQDTILAADYNDVWAFYIPEFIPVYGFDTCILTRFQMNTSSIITYEFDSCPTNQLNFNGVLDLQGVYFAEGNPNPYVAYTSTFAYLVIVNQTQVLFEKILNVNTPGEVNVNFTGKIATIIRNDPNLVQAYTVNINSGQIIKTLNISNALYAGSFRMNDYYYMIGASLNGSYCLFSVLDVNSLTIVSNFTVKTRFVRWNYFLSPFFVMGTDEDSPNFSAIVLQKLNHEPELIGPEGQVINLNIELNSYDQSFYDQNTFLATYYDGIYYFNKYITLSD